MENKFENITALVPEGEYFDAAAVNEGVFLTGNHLVNIEASLAGQQSATAAMLQQVDGANQAATDVQAKLDTATQTITEKEATIKQLQDEVAALKAKPASDFKESGKEKDEHGGGAVAELSEITKEANQKRAAMGLPLIK